VNHMHRTLLPVASLVTFAAFVPTGCGRGQVNRSPESAAATGGAQPNAATTAHVNPASPTAEGTTKGSTPLGDAGKLLTDPDGIDLFFLQYSISGAAPSFSDLAGLDSTVQSANEFNRDDARAKVEAQLRARAEAVRGTRLLQVSLNDSFGQYDPKYKEYDFQMGSGTVVPFNSLFRREVDLALTNGGLAQSWKLEPSEAEDVLRRTGGDRHVLLVLKLQVLDAPPPVSGAPLRINTRVLEYEIRSTLKNIHLGQVIVEK
jgi:hypothetical protein